MMSQVAQHISGKNTPLFRKDRVSEGAICVLVNIKDPLVTGGRIRNKVIRYHTGFIGHLRQFTYGQILQKKPRLLYEWTLWKMMAKHKLTRAYFKNLITFEGPIHNLPFLPQFKPDNTDYLVKSVEQSKERTRQQLQAGSVKPQFGSLDDPIYKTKLNMSQSQIAKLRRRHLKLAKRYVKVPAIKKKNKLTTDAFKAILSEKQARKEGVYEELRSEGEVQEDEEEGEAENEFQ